MCFVKKIFSACCLHVFCFSCVCVFKCSTVSFLQETPFFLCDDIVFVISTLMWTKKSSFSCEKEISQLFINCGACCGRGEDLRKSSFSLFHVFFYCFFRTAFLFISNIYHLIDKMVTFWWLPRMVWGLAVFLYSQTRGDSTLWELWQHCFALLQLIEKVSWENQKTERGIILEVTLQCSLG